MDLSIEFTVRLKTDVFQTEAQAYLISLNQDFKINYMFNLFVAPEEVIKAALMFGFMDENDTAYWAAAPLDGVDVPTPMSRAERSREFYEKYTTFELVHPAALQERGEISVLVHKYDGSGSPIVFHGFVTKITSVVPDTNS